MWHIPLTAHFAATIGLPAAGMASLCLVLVLRTVAGPIKFKGLGFEFDGAAGPIIMWVICFLAIAIGIKTTWPLVTHPATEDDRAVHSENSPVNSNH